MNEIEKARELQKECVKLHMVPPILGIVKVEKLNVNKEVIESFEQKSNSYVRNAYNFMMYVASGMSHIPETMIPSHYSDEGYVFKQESGTLRRTFPTGSLTINDMLIGSDSTPDTINDYRMGNEITTATSTPVKWTGSLISKTLQTVATTTYINTNVSPMIVGEVGLMFSTTYLMVRDVFTPIILNQFEGVTITYTLELLYP